MLGSLVLLHCSDEACARGLLFDRLLFLLLILSEHLQNVPERRDHASRAKLGVDFRTRFAFALLDSRAHKDAGISVRGRERLVVFLHECRGAAVGLEKRGTKIILRKSDSHGNILAAGPRADPLKRLEHPKVIIHRHSHVFLDDNRRIEQGDDSGRPIDVLKQFFHIRRGCVVDKRLTEHFAWIVQRHKRASDSVSGYLKVQVSRADRAAGPAAFLESLVDFNTRLVGATIDRSDGNVFRLLPKPTVQRRQKDGLTGLRATKHHYSIAPWRAGAARRGIRRRVRDRERRARGLGDLHGFGLSGLVRHAIASLRMVHAVVTLPEMTPHAKRSSTSSTGSDREPIRLGDVGEVDPTLRWRILLGGVTVICVASVLGNIALGAIMSGQLSLRRERDSAVERAETARVEKAAAEQTAKDAEGRLGKSEELVQTLRREAESHGASAQADRTALARAKKELEGLKADPAGLPVIERAALLKQVRTFRVEAAVSSRAAAAGIRDGMVADEAKSAARSKGKPHDDASESIAYIRVSGTNETRQGAVWFVQISVMQRWRAPGTDASCLVAVYEDGQFVEAPSSTGAAEVLKGVSEVVGRLCDELAKSSGL